MINKQIIDVCPYQGECSVSGCKRNDDGCFVRQLFEERNRAENRIVELNKSIQAKEQDCEKLRQYHNKCCEEFEKEKKEWLEKYNQVSRDFYSGKYCNAEKCQQLDQLKAENKDLQEQIRKHNDDMFKNPPEKRFYCKGCTLPYISKKLKQTLVEIKEIVSSTLDCGEWIGQGDNKMEAILQKISEVLNEKQN